MKLREDEDTELRSIEKLQREETERTNGKTEEKVNELIARSLPTHNPVHKWGQAGADRNVTKRRGRQNVYDTSKRHRGLDQQQQDMDGARG